MGIGKEHGLRGTIFTFLQSLLETRFRSTFYVVYKIYNVLPSMAYMEEIENEITV